MYKVVLRVVRPRKNGKHRQEPGTLITIEEKDLKEFRRQILLHKAKCVLHEGELPDLKLKKPLRQGTKKKPKMKDGSHEGGSYASFRELTSEKTDKEVKEEIKKIDSLTCPTCQKEFKSEASLRRHMERADHG